MKTECQLRRELCFAAYRQDALRGRMMRRWNAYITARERVERGADNIEALRHAIAARKAEGGGA